MDPIIPADIGTALFVLLFLVVAFQVLRWIGPKLAALRVRTIEDDSGDQGGVTIPPEMQRAAKRPRAPDTGSGLLDESGTRSKWSGWIVPASWRDERKARD